MDRDRNTNGDGFNSIDIFLTWSILESCVISSGLLGGFKPSFWSGRYLNLVFCLHKWQVVMPAWRTLHCTAPFCVHLYSSELCRRPQAEQVQTDWVSLRVQSCFRKRQAHKHNTLTLWHSQQNWSAETKQSTAESRDLWIILFSSGQKCEGT